MVDIVKFLNARIDEDEVVAQNLLRDLNAQIEAEGYGPDERGPYTPTRMLKAQLWAHFDGQTRWRNFARGQQIAKLADPTRVLASCEARRRIVALHVRDAGSAADEPGNCRRCDTSGIEAQGYPCDTLQALAAPYADDLDFDPTWAS